MSCIIFIKVPWHFAKITFFFFLKNCFYFSIDQIFNEYFSYEIIEAIGVCRSSLWTCRSSCWVCWRFSCWAPVRRCPSSWLRRKSGEIPADPGKMLGNPQRNDEKWRDIAWYSWENMGKPSVNGQRYEGSARLGRSSKWRISQAVKFPAFWWQKISDVGPKWTASMWHPMVSGWFCRRRWELALSICSCEVAVRWSLNRSCRTRPGMGGVWKAVVPTWRKGIPSLSH